ncbi:MAG: DUF4178 domain-containing protein [Flavobacteriales bacterium]|nr:DUF4178 domain-containing protein [Flavobacteriales bacterium]
MFGRFKKKKGVKIDYSSKDLAKGFVFEYYVQNWIVTEEYEYDWGEGYFTKEFKITSGKESFFLSVEEDDGLVLSLTTKSNAPEILSAFKNSMRESKKPLEQIEFEGRSYFLLEESPGYFRDCSKNSGKDDDDWSELISWDYQDKDEKHVLSVEQWGENNFEFSHGMYIQEFEISNILPASDD